MSRKAATLKESERPRQPSPRTPSALPQLRLVPPQSFPSAPQPKVKIQPTPESLQQDPLEQPTRSHCGLCGNKIEDRAVTEDRTSGRNMKAQTWFYHEVCWKQLERMRRLDHSWHSHKAINPEIRYSASESRLDGIARRSEPFSLITG